MKSNNNSYIQYNSVFSISIFSEEYENTNYAKYLLTEDNLEHLLSFKICKKPLIDYSNLKRSYFYIRNIDECDDENQKLLKKKPNIKKELGFLSKKKIHQNNQFYLQHMISKMFISIERTNNNNKFILKLTKNIENAANFALRKINEKRNSKEILTTKELYHLSIYMKEDDQFFFLGEDKKPIYKGDDKYYNILIEKKPITKIFLTDQIWNIKDTKNIYSGQLLNIIFSIINENKEEHIMLGVEKKKKKIKALI